MENDIEPGFNIGDKVQKVVGDYTFKGVIVSRFEKTTGKLRFVVENTDGVLHIFSRPQLEKWIC